MMPRLFAALLQSCLTLLAVSFLVYMLIGLMPGDPVDLMIAGDPKLTPADAARLRALYGVDQPLWSRYLVWLGKCLQGDFGYSRLFGLPVMAVILPKLLNTLLLMGLALTLTLLLAIPAGVLAAQRTGKFTDKILSTSALAFMSLPPFWTGLLLITVFAVIWHALPASSTLDGALVDSLRALVLPVITLTLAGVAVYLRHMRASMIGVLHKDYIRTARAKGCSEGRTIWGHAFRNAALPVITLLMLDVGTLFGGALTVETVFAFPGMGKLMFDAVMGNDYNLALCGFLFLTATVLAASFTVDVVYRLFDPRIRTGKV